MAPERSVFSVLGAGLPTATNWLDVEWVLTLFELCSNGIEFLEFQIWASTVARGIHCTPDVTTHAKAPVLPGAWGVSQVLGTKLPGVENWLNMQWLKALFTLKSRGVKFAAFRSWSRNVAVGSPFSPEMDSSRRPLGLVESLPNLLLDKQALQHKSLELAKFVEKLDHSRFYEREYLEDIKAHLEELKTLYWRRSDVTVTIQAKLGGNGVPERVHEVYMSKPQVHGRIVEVVTEGSNCKPWVLRCGNSIGVHGSKKAARMIAIIRECIDPFFDPDTRKRTRLDDATERLQKSKI